MSHVGLSDTLEHSDRGSAYWDAKHYEQSVADFDSVCMPMGPAVNSVLAGKC